MVVPSPTLPLFLLLLITSSSCDPLSPPDVSNQALALESMRKNLLDPLGVLWDWDPDPVNPCTYSCVICSDDNRVIRLEVPSRNLSGLVWMRMYSFRSTCVEVDWSRIKLSSIPFHSNTCGFKWIHMHPNKASGRLSPSVGNLTSLESLVLSDNNITGTIPAEIGKLRGLKNLDLSSNHLHGEIPSSVFHLQSLQYLDLSYNNLSGPIPRSFAGTLYVVGNPLICGENTGQDCSSSRTAPVPASKFVVAFGSTVACIIFLL